MKIVLMADNRKTELLVNFCIAYVSGLSVDYSSGFEQLASRAEYNGIDCVIYLRDGRQVGESNPFELLDVCDQNTIPYATNIASAEILVTAIDSGALDYREWNAV